MTKIEIEVKLSDEDRGLLSAVATGLKGSTATAGKPGKGKPAADEDDFGDTGTGGDDDFGDTEKTYEKSDVQEALRAFAAVSSKADAIKLMNKYGGSDALSKLEEAKYGAVVKAAEAATAKASKKK